MKSHSQQEGETEDKEALIGKREERSSPPNVMDGRYRINNSFLNMTSDGASVPGLSDNQEINTKEFQKRMLRRYKDLQQHETYTEGISSEISKYRGLIQQFFLMPIKESEQVYIRWDNINYYVRGRSWSNAVMRKTEAATDNCSNIHVDFESITPDGLVKAKAIPGVLDKLELEEKQNTNPYMKQILHGMDGYCKPGECVAILGPSGSGKTSLLNVLSGRINLSSGSKFTGKITSNGRPLVRSDFGKFAAFVQQHDIMMASMTPREAFVFAQKLRTNLDNSLIEVRADQLIQSLGLKECADQQIGAGLRAGQLKRVSIGYELATNPSLVLLDEPTSGLDSLSAFQIAKLLKREARRGLTVLATIHQPAAETFLQFDRCILLAEGRTIYNGPPSKIRAYFESKGFVFKKYTNLADWMLRLAMDTKTLNANQTVAQLARDCRIQYALDVQKQASYFAEKDEHDHSFTALAQNRQTSFFKEFWLLFKRNLVFLWRYPKSTKAFVLMTLCQCFLMCGVFEGVGHKRLDMTYEKELKKKRWLPPSQKVIDQVKESLRQNKMTMRDYLGFIFYCSSDQFISIAIGQCLFMPMQWPVYVREKSSRMFSTGAFFLASFTASTLNFLVFQPIIYATLSFVYVGFHDSSRENYLEWLGILIIQGINGSTYGFAFGNLISDPIMCLVVAQFVLYCIYFGGGAFAQYHGDATALQDFFTVISPFKYATELMMAVMLKGLDYKDQALQVFDMQEGDKCLPRLLMFFIFWFTFSWLALWYRSRRL